MKKGFSIMEEMIPKLMASEEWTAISLHDPEIRASEEEVSTIFKKLKSNHPEEAELFFDLDCAVGRAETAYMMAAILYGMSVAMDIRAAMANLTAYLQYIEAGRGAA